MLFGNIYVPWNMLLMEALCEYELLVENHGETTSSHLLNICKGVCKSPPPPPNKLSKKKQDMHHMFHNPIMMKLCQFTVKIQGINNLLPHFLSAEESNNTPEEDLNKNLLHYVPHC